jgi:hypothetical protein
MMIVSIDILIFIRIEVYIIKLGKEWRENHGEDEGRDEADVFHIRRFIIGES